MSMNLYVVLALTVAPSSSEINISAQELNVPIEISATDLSTHSGFLPIKVSGNDSGVEIYVYAASEIADLISDNEQIDVGSSIVFEFSWGGNFKEAAAAFYTAQVLTAKYNGVAFDPQSGMFLDSKQMAEGAQAFINFPE